MQVKGLNQSTIQQYTRQALSKDEGNFWSTSKVEAKKNLSGTLHIKNVYTVKKIMAEYDLTDMSSEDMKKMSQALFDAGIISREDCQLLAFQPELNPEYQKDLTSEDNSQSATQGRKNFIDLWHRKVLNHRQEGAKRAALQADQMVNVLENLNIIRM